MIQEDLIRKASTLNVRVALRALADFAWGDVRLSDGTEWPMPRTDRHHAHLVPYVASLLLLHGAQGTRHLEQRVAPEDIQYLLRGALAMGDQPLAGEPDPGVAAVRAHVQRATLYQNRSQRSWQQEIPRAVYLYGDLLARVSPTLYQDIQRRCSDLPERDMGLFFALVWIIFHGFMGREFTRGQLATWLAPTNIAEGEVDRALDSLSITPEAYAKRADSLRQQPDEPTTHFYEFNPLFERPIIEVCPHRYIVPSPDCLLYALTDGAYYRLYNRYCDLEDRPDNSFSTEFGRVFERYVFEQVASLRPQIEVLPEFECQGGKFVECTAIEGREAVLFECKTRRLPLAAQVTGASPAMDAFVKESLGKGLGQLKRCISDARAGRTGTRADGLDRYYPVVVIMHPFPLVNVEDVRQLVAEDAAPQVSEHVARYQILDISEVEDIVALHPRLSLCSVMREKTSDESYEDNMHNFLRDLARSKQVRPSLPAILPDVWEGLKRRFVQLLAVQ